MRLGTTVLAGCAMALAVYSAVHAQSKSVWDGVYSQAQAKRGEGVYTQQCATCHGEDLKGKEDLKPDPSPPLTVPDLGLSFDDTTLDMMADRIRTSMPKDKPNTLSREQVADVVSFILSKNGMPAGQGDLPSAAGPQKEIKFLTKKP